MREALAHAVNSSNLGMEENCTHDADRLAAMAFGPRLGSLLLRYRDGRQARWQREALAMIAHKIVKRHRISMALAFSVAKSALDEWASPHCPACGGARQIMTENLVVICHECNGLGSRRYSDTERARAIGAWGGRISAGHALALVIVTSSVAESLRAAKAKIG